MSGSKTIRNKLFFASLLLGLALIILGVTSPVLGESASARSDAGTVDAPKMADRVKKEKAGEPSPQIRQVSERVTIVIRRVSAQAYQPR